MKVVVIDNYDSFTWNIVQYLQVLGAEVEVFRNDAITVEGIGARRPDRLLISPGPCDPDRAGISMDAIRRWAPKLPLLGVCLGHQSLGQVYGGEVVRAPVLMHGKTSPIHHEGQGVFTGLPQPFTATRYHSLVVRRESLPEVLEVTAWTEDGTIMGLRHRELPAQGVQFHPESILTEGGMQLLENFLEAR
ncbi:MAG: aminodeoxychorismate/anthranilate synthase component II [Alphaproteobacteria bacterium]|nr:aminodeoxychorismate/anthranilate synthase component II [Alphaproteobacteria bacterium]MCB9794393.1 aminodeoxychorismate/anthranilate synthase component II [Alphaproteobacteria bacterium]